MNTAFLAKIDSRVRPWLVRALPPKAVIKLYSKGRLQFMSKMIASPPLAYAPPKELAVTLWGITFRSPVLNAAGMFKNGEGYQFVAAQGAGAYLAGTTTANPRTGNRKNGVALAFAPYPGSHASSNWLGLPNEGDKAVAERLRNLPRVQGCPVGASVMGSPDLEGEEKLEGLIRGMRLFEEAGVDFLEINESCPNTEDGSPQEGGLAERLERIKSDFLDSRPRSVPVIVKFSNDTPLAQVPDLLKMVVELGFDGVNFGNTSTRYEEHRKQIAESDRRLYEFFTSTYGGGLGGAPLRQSSLQLICEAKRCLNANPAPREFHLIRTGGVETAEDVLESMASGASLVEWYTGYFEQFSIHGHGLYRELYEKLLAEKQ